MLEQGAILVSTTVTWQWRVEELPTRGQAGCPNAVMGHVARNLVIRSRGHMRFVAHKLPGMSASSGTALIPVLLSATAGWRSQTTGDEVYLDGGRSVPRLNFHL